MGLEIVYRSCLSESSMLLTDDRKQMNESRLLMLQIALEFGFNYTEAAHRYSFHCTTSRMWDGRNNSIFRNSSNSSDITRTAIYSP